MVLVTPTTREHRIRTSYGYVRVIGRSKPLVDAVLRECGDGVPLSRAAGAGVERMIGRAERMKQAKEWN